MTPLFADTFFYIALLSHDDSHHRRAVDFARANHRPILTTHYVLTEFLDAFSATDARSSATAWVHRLQSDPLVTIIENEARLWNQALQLYNQRPDKHWSLTDCTSFITMKQKHLTEALTHDHHFHQAGFRIMF